MDVMTAILTRRSEQVLVEPSPGEEEFAYLLRGAAAFPDHGPLDPWRWILLRGEDRRVLGDCLAGDDGPDGSGPGGNGPGGAAAPLLAALVLAPRGGPRPPEWEPVSAAGGMVHALILLLHSRGYGSTWRIGRRPHSPATAAALGLGAGERLLGGLSIGTPAAGAPPRRALADVAAQLSVFRAAPAPAPAR
ncbi:nitroreductase family protein [Streptomyces sp. NBC_00503]|uniref:nitroreductase family protein n=1 Tax=Streptomyces sp. NBC_00503 TaxID=2903659 RepID=UPI002E7FC27E|nr:nitroreductase family protein [Streptomyces sp. NBC_00503]WUD86424.1 nitroreductase [Streptomyces sp. NBC_00503]